MTSYWNVLHKLESKSDLNSLGKFAFSQCTFPFEGGEDTEVKACHAYFFSYSFQFKLFVLESLMANFVNHCRILLLSQNIPGPLDRSLQVIISGCLPKDDFRNWLEALFFLGNQK